MSWGYQKQDKERLRNKPIDPDTLPFKNKAVKESVKQLGECLSTFIKSLANIRGILKAERNEINDPATHELIDYIIKHAIKEFEPEQCVNEVYRNILVKQNDIEMRELQNKRKHELSAIFDN